MIRHPKEEEIPRLFEIWERCFGDTREYIRLFFKQRFEAEETWVADQQGTIQAVLYLLPCRICTYSGKIPARYIYAAATHPDAQGLGLMTKLLDHAAKECKDRGIGALALVPGSRELFQFYEKRGYQTTFSLTKAWLQKPETETSGWIENKRLSAKQMLEIRETILQGRSFVDWGEDALEHVLQENRMQGGQVVSVSYEGQKGYALCLPNEKQVFINEWMVLPSGYEALAQAVLRTFPGKNILLRTAPGLLPEEVKSEKVPFGMSVLLQPTIERFGPDAYLGLPMD